MPCHPPARTAPQTCKARAAPSPAKCVDPHLSARTRTRVHHTRALALARARTHAHTNTHAHTHANTCSISGSSVDSPRSQKGEWDAILEKSWIKLRPHASVPIAEETRKTQEQFFPLTLTSYEYVAKPIAEETAASDEVTPSAGKTIGKIKAPTISKQISKPVC